MSYIRSLSNPEGLYIISTGDSINIMVAGRKTSYYLPIEEFHSVLKQYLADQGDEEKYTSGDTTLMLRRWKWVLKHGDFRITMFESTLWYLAETNKFRWEDDSNSSPAS